MDKQLCIMPYLDFNGFIDALKPFVRQDPAHDFRFIYVQGDEANKTLTGYAVDGFKMAKQVAEKVHIDRDFSCYILPPRFRASSADEYVKLSMSEDEADAYISFGDVTIRTRQPKGEHAQDYLKLYKQLADHVYGDPIGVNRQYLREAAHSLYERGRPQPIVLQTGSYAEPIKLSVGKNERFVLPVRIRRGPGT